MTILFYHENTSYRVRAERWFDYETALTFATAPGKESFFGFYEQSDDDASRRITKKTFVGTPVDTLAGLAQNAKILEGTPGLLSTFDYPHQPPAEPAAPKIEDHVAPEILARRPAEPQGIAGLFAEITGSHHKKCEAFERLLSPYDQACVTFEKTVWADYLRTKKAFESQRNKELKAFLEGQIQKGECAAVKTRTGNVVVFDTRRENQVLLFDPATSAIFTYDDRNTPMPAPQLSDCLTKQRGVSFVHLSK